MRNRKKLLVRNVLGLSVAAAALVACLVYLMACGIFAFRPMLPAPHTTEIGSMTFTFHGSMEEALAECAAELRKQYGTNIAVTVKGKTLSYKISFPTPTGYDEVTDTIALGDDADFGQGACKLTYNLAVKERPAPFLLAPLHYLVHWPKKPRSGDITHDLEHKLSQMAGRP